MSELGEMREKLASILDEIINWSWIPDPDQASQDAVKEILSLSTDSLRIAVVRKKGELPKRGDSIPSWDNAIEEMLDAGYVQEEKDETV